MTCQKKISTQKGGGFPGLNILKKGSMRRRGAHFVEEGAEKVATKCGGDGYRWGREVLVAFVALRVITSVGLCFLDSTKR